MKTELIIGCGATKFPRIWIGDADEYSCPIYLDNNPSHKPDIIHDLNDHPLPFDDESFNEIHAYEVLEHLGSQGDYKFFFAEFTEYHRILRPGGKFFATVPSRMSPWAWGDPSHTRIFCPEWLVFLSQETYKNDVGKTTMSDFRYLYKADFKVFEAKLIDDNQTFAFILEKV